MSNDPELSFDNINILNTFIQIKQTQIPTTLILIILTLIYVIITLVLKFKKSRYIGVEKITIKKQNNNYFPVNISIFPRLLYDIDVRFPKNFIRISKILTKCCLPE